MSEVLAQLSEAGVALWLDDLSRDRISTGNLATLVRDKHIVGVTTNPTIFQKAIVGSELYDPQLKDLAQRRVDVEEAVRMITTADVRDACDLLRPTYEASGHVDGRVSIEVDPRLAHDTATTIAEARQLWWLVDRPNLFIKIPATVQGLPAIGQALAEGISVNVTLIFSIERYRAVMAAFLDGLERRRASGGSLEGLSSVASFFVSRVDTEIDKRLGKVGSDEAQAMLGEAAIANARLAYEAYEEVFTSERWKSLEADGAKAQRPLWASTGVKDPKFDDTRYVIELAAPGTVNTMPEGTLDAVDDHGVFAGETVRGRYGDAHATMKKLADLGVDYDDVVAVLEDEGVDKFMVSWNELLEAVKGQLEDKAPAASAKDDA